MGRQKWFQEIVKPRARRSQYNSFAFEVFHCFDPAAFRGDKNAHIGCQRCDSAYLMRFLPSAFPLGREIRNSSVGHREFDFA